MADSINVVSIMAVDIKRLSEIDLDRLQPDDQKRVLQRIVDLTQRIQSVIQTTAEQKNVVLD